MSSFQRSMPKILHITPINVPHSTVIYSLCFRPSYEERKQAHGSKSGGTKFKAKNRYIIKLSLTDDNTSNGNSEILCF